jgi:RND superfamily putative drug exporter
MLVPSLMYLFGKASWWLPEGVDRRLPRPSIEGPQTTAEETHG